MPGCYGVKFLLQSIWLKIEIWDLQGMYINGMNLVFLDPDNPHHKFVKTCRGLSLSTYLAVTDCCQVNCLRTTSPLLPLLSYSLVFTYLS